MQRWFYANEEEVCVKSPPPTSTSSSTSAEIPAPPPPAKQWRFCVSMPCHIMCNEHLAVVGDCDLLGNWQLEDCVLMEKYEEGKWFMI